MAEMATISLHDAGRQLATLLTSREQVACGRLLILLCHKLLRRDGAAIGALQHGHRGRLLTSAPISRRRMVAIEFGM